MKKISLVLIAVLVVSMLLPLAAFAADTDFTMAFDFNDYNATSGSGVVPSDEWSHFSGGSAFGSDSGALKIGNQGKPALRLTNPIKCVSPVDAMHISFRAKTTGSLMVGTLKNNNNHNEDATTVVMNNRARHNMIKITPSNVSWDSAARDGGCSGYSWARPQQDSEWHRYDLVRASDGSWTFYVDGVNIMTNIGTCKEHAWGGMHGSAFSWLYFYESGSGSTVDDVKVRVEHGSLSGLSMTKIGDDRVERDNGVLKVQLSEPVDAALLTNSNFKISNNVSGDVVTNFELVVDGANGVADSFTVNFGADTLTSGDYTVAIDSAVIGLLTGTSASNLVFKPAYKTTDGVIHPEAELIQFIGIDDSPVELSDSMNAGVKEIVIRFNTLIDKTDIESYVILSDESGVVENLVYEVTDQGENSVLTIQLTELLKPYEEYTFVIGKGIPAAANGEVKSENDDNYTFKTAMPNEGGTVFGVTRNEVVAEENKYYFGIAKTTEDSVKLTAIAAAYKTVTDAESGESYEQMIECKFFPIVLESTQSGSFNYEEEFTADLTQEGITIKTYLIEYPSMLPSNL